MKILDLANPERGDARLMRTAAVTFIGARPSSRSISARR
jgi:hypothetical protein